MMRKAQPCLSLALFLTLFAISGLHAQQPAGPGLVDSTSQASSVRTFSFSGTVPGQPDGSLSVTFAIYTDQQSTTPLWTETQVVQISSEKYSTMLGSSSATGLPEEIFAADQAHWLGVQANGKETRYLLVSVPYAMKAVEAERLGGLLPTDFVTTQQLQSILQTSAGQTAGTTPAPKQTTGVQNQAAAAGTPPLPATDFTDNNGSEVLLVTQQGTGYAIHAVSSAQPEAIFSENSSIGGTALRGFASNPSGQSIGLLAEVASPDGISAMLNNRAGGKILSLRSVGGEVAWFDSNGLNVLGQVQAGNFAGSGAGLTNIPPSAVGATSLNNPNTVVMRDATASFAANQIFATTFLGDGSGLFNIPPSAVGATSLNNPNTVVMRDATASFAANQIFANTFQGSGAGLFNIPPSAVGATFLNNPNTVVMRDSTASFAANQIFANNFLGNGSGLFNIPPSAVGATDANLPSTIVARDASGNFSANNIFASVLNVFGQLTNAGLTDLSNGSTLPVHAVTSVNTPVSCIANRELLIKTDAAPGQQLFICNATANGWNLVGDGTAAGVTSIGAGDASISVGGTATAPTIAVADGSITSAKLAPNAVVSSIADGSLSPTKVTGTAATLGSNSFTGSQTVQQNLTVNGVINNSLGIVTSNSVFAAGGNFTGSTTGQLLTVSNTNTAGSAMLVNGNLGIGVGGTVQAINASSVNGIGIKTTSNSSFGLFASSTNAVGIHADGGTIGLEAVSSTNGSALRAFGIGNAPIAIFDSNIVGPGVTLLSGRRQGVETFAFDNAGNWSSQGGLTVSYPNNTTTGTFVQFLAKLDSTGAAVVASTSDTSGIIGIVATGSGTSGQAHIVYSGMASCNFDGTAQAGHYVGISQTQGGRCADIGALYPPFGQVIGRVVSSGVSQNVYNVLVFGQPQRDSNPGTLTAINTGAGLTGGPITSSGTISIANNGVTNSMLQNAFLFVNSGQGISGGGPVPLGGSITLSNAGTLSFNGRTGNVVAAPGDYSFAQIAGTAATSQLPGTTVYSNQSNTFTGDQTIQGNLNTTSVNAGGNVNANSISTSSANFTGAAGVASVLAVNDNGTGGISFSVNSNQNPAALFMSRGPTVLMAGTITGATTILSTNGDLSLNGTATAHAFAGDGSALTNVSASKIGTLGPADIATATALNSETTARQSADTTLQTDINNEASARVAEDATLSASIAAETSARQSDVSNLQTSISNVSAADAKLAASNTFTAGTQDFSGAGATLPVRALLSANTPAACVTSKELLIKTDAPAGQQLFICNATGDGWNLVGDGARGEVTTFNGRSGSVTPASGDYSFAQISGSAATSQLPATIAYNNQANTFTGNQTVNGTVTATSFSGSGAALTGVNAASLNGIPSNAFAQLHAINTFTSEQAFAASTAVNPSLNIPAGVAPATPLAGDVWNTGTVLQYRDNASATRSVVSTTQTGGLQLLKLTASITPASVSSQSCIEQSFSVSGITTGDVLLSVLQPSTTSPGTNIAIGGFRVSAANTVAVQFCNVSRNNSTPTSGTYTFALMR